MQGVQRVDGGRIPDESYDDSTWEGGRDRVEMENSGRGGRSMEFTNEFPSKGMPAELPVGGMPGTTGDKYGNSGALPAPSFPRHRVHSGGGKLLPPTMRPM